MYIYNESALRVFSMSWPYMRGIYPPGSALCESRFYFVTHRKKYNPFFLIRMTASNVLLRIRKLYCQQKQKSTDLKQLSNSKRKFARVRYDNLCRTFFLPHFRWCHRPLATSITEQCLLERSS